MRSFVLAAILLCVSQAVAADEFEQLLIRAQSSSGTWSHLDGAVLMRGNQPVCAFGVKQIGDGKPQYTYFILFREMPKSTDEFKVTGPLNSEGESTDYKVTIAIGKKSFEIAHKMELDEATRKLITDDLRVGGEMVKANGPKVFVVDMAGDSPLVKPIDHELPAIVVSPRGEEDRLGVIKKVVADYIRGSRTIPEALERAK